MIIEKQNRLLKIDNHYMYLLITLVISTIAFYLSIIFEYEIYQVFRSINFLTWHTILELISIILAFIIFSNCYYSYRHLGRIRLLVLAITFMISGSIDFLHALSYEGMPYTFAQSSTILATTYWISARLFMATGLFLTSIIPFYYKKAINKTNILIIGIGIVFTLFYMINFKIELLPPLFIEGVGLTPLKLYLEYIIIGLQLMAIYFYLKTYRKIQNKHLIILCCGLILSIFSESLFTLYKSVYDTYNLLGHIFKILGFYLIYYSIFKYNIDLPFNELKNAKDRIRLYANNLEIIIDKRTNEIKKVNQRLINELEYAKLVQQSLLPSDKLNYNGISFISNFLPCEKLSGDFYDIYSLDENNIGMYILDVSGHGVSAALLTMMSTYLIKSLTTGKKRFEPDKKLQKFYSEFNILSLPSEMHLVIFYAVYNKSNSILTYCSGGMNCYPILFRKNGEYEYLDKSEGFPMCQFNDFYTPEYKSAKIRLNQGDRVLFYTDGLTDKNKNQVFNENQLIELIIKNNHRYLDELNSEIALEIKNRDVDLDDDITYFIMEIE